MSLPEVTRRMFADSDKKRDAGLTTPEDISRDDDISYGKFGVWNHLDVYKPKQANGPLPVIVSCHGGGWVYGDKEVYQHYCMSLAQRGFVVVNYNYRLAPEDKFPFSLYDTDNVFRWINDNKDIYGFDTDNVFAVGDSAGANLLCVYINLINDEEYVNRLNTYFTNNKEMVFEKSKSIEESDYAYIKDFKPQKHIKIKAVGLNCGKYGFEEEKKKPGLKDLVKSLFVNEGTHEEFELLDVLTNINEKFPPAFIMTCTGDFLIKEAGKLADVLEDKGVPFEYHFYSHPKREKSLGHVFHCNMRLDSARICNDEECNFFKKHIK